jgi:hypothetical protein
MHDIACTGWGSASRTSALAVQRARTHTRKHTLEHLAHRHQHLPHTRTRASGHGVTLTMDKTADIGV